MGYRAAVLFRWSRRDRLAVLVVALTVAFLVGTTLLILAAGAQTAAIAAEYDTPGFVTHHDTLDAARAAATPGAVVLPVAEVALPAGGTGYVVGRPAGAPEFATDRPLFPADEGATRGDLGGRETHRLDGRRGTVALEVAPRGETLLPPSWYTASPETVERLGPTGAFVVEPAAASGRVDRGTPLRAALTFFLVGTGELLRALVVAAVGGGLLVGVTVYSVTRMSVRDRLRAIRVIRATGGTPGRVRRLFALRAALVALAGTALGYALGVILPSAAVNLAVYTGLPTSLSIRVTDEAVRILLPLLSATVLVGAVAGFAAAWPASRRPPGRLGEPTEPTGRRGAASGATTDGTIRGAVAPALLGWRALVPTATTLAAFVLFAVLVSSAAGVAAPLASAEGGTITEPGAPHPFASRVPAAYADALESQGLAASPEVLLLSVVDGRPFVARGANYTAFARTTDVRIERGRAPRAAGEALIGGDLARALGVSVGDRVTLGGSTRSGFTRVAVVGAYTAPGPFDDGLLVSLPTSRHLAGLPPGQVQFVRVPRLPDRPSNASGIGVVDVAAPDSAVANGSIRVRITLWNDGLSADRVTVPVRFGGHERTVTESLPSRTQRTVAVDLPTGPPGTYTLRVGATTRPVTVVDPDTIVFRDLPDRVPPNSRPLIRVVDANGAPVPDARVSVVPADGGPADGGPAENATARTDSEGRVRVPFSGPGAYRLAAERGDRSATATVVADPDARRELRADLRVRPSAPSLLTRPEARLDLANPWAVAVSRSVTLATPTGEVRRDVSLDPGARTSIVLRIDRLPPGTYSVRAEVDDRPLATTAYTVTGDDRVVAALAGSDRVRGTGIGRAIETAFGNLRLLLGVVLSLAGLMTVGATTATFAQAVHARRRTIGIYRATGASPSRVLRLVLRDALVVGSVATVLALAAGGLVVALLGRAGYLTVFGVGLATAPSPPIVAAIALGSLLLTLLGAALAAVGLLRTRPAALLSEERTEPYSSAGGDPRG